MSFYSAPREWTRMHPVTPVLKGWPVLVSVGALWFYTGGPAWLGGSELSEVSTGWRLGLLAWAGIAFGGLIFAVGAAALMWRVNVYRITDTAVEHNKGLVFRTQTQARLDRLQAVDVVQPVLARAFGLAQVKVEVAGGEQSGVLLEYVRAGEAEALRNEIVALAAGYKTAMRAGAMPGPAAADNAQADATEAPAGEPAPGTAAVGTATTGTSAAQGPVTPVVVNPFAQQRYATAVAAATTYPVYRVPPIRLLGAMIRSWGAVFGVVTFVFLGGMGFIISSLGGEFSVEAFVGGSIAGVIGAGFAVVAAAFSAINRSYNFKASVSTDGIHLRHGLLETRKQTVPPGRVQALVFQQQLLWRRKDWWRVSINVAGYQDAQSAGTLLLPVGPRREALGALFLALPDVGDPNPEGVISLALDGSGEEGGFLTSPKRSWILDPWQWRRRGVRATDTALLIRHGLFTKSVYVVPHERTQELVLQQGPIQRALRLASITVRSTVGPVRPVAHHLDVQDAIALLDAQAQRARQRRKVQTPEQWAKKVGLPAPGAPAPESAPTNLGGTE